MSKTKPSNTVKGFPLIFPMGESYTEVLKLITDIKDRVDALEKGSEPQLSTVTTTYNELRSLRDNGELIPGTFYRITDYECTTTLENTQSAGHKFDIILLALSEDSLEEEGWAIRNENNLYDVTFSDNVTKKCWIYFDGSHYNIVDDKTQLGDNSLSSGDITLNFSAKTASCPTLSSDSLTIENLSYNNDYFKNSNLSAWKVWYCLDNDTSRFGWADNGGNTAYITVSGGAYSEGTRLYRDPSKDIILDNVQYYNWSVPESATLKIWTTSETPSPTDGCYLEKRGIISPLTITTIVDYTLPEGDGRGVIYRLIDEWGNDCPYDFKNIQYGTVPFVAYTFVNIDADTQNITDTSVDNTISRSIGNKIESLMDLNTGIYILPGIVIHHYGICNKFENCSLINVYEATGNRFICCSETEIIKPRENMIYIYNDPLVLQPEEPLVSLE